MLRFEWSYLLMQSCHVASCVVYPFNRLSLLACLSGKSEIYHKSSKLTFSAS